MKKIHRKILSDLCSYCNDMGTILDATATNQQKYIDRQKAHMLVYKVLYGVLCDQPENDFSREDLMDSEVALKKIAELVKKNYPDRNGH